MVGNSIQLSAEGTYSNNETRDLTAEVHWTCSESQLAQIEKDGDQAGRLTALSVGLVTVTASLDDVSTSIAVMLTFITWTTKISADGALDGKCIRQTSDGGFILSGRVQQADLTWDVYLSRLDPWGSVLWEKTYGGSGNDSGNSVVEAGGRFIVAGQTAAGTTSDVYLLCTDQDGTIEWEKTFGGSLDDYATSIRTTADGNLIVAGSSAAPTDITGGSSINWDVYLLKTDMNGDLIWETTLTAIDGGVSGSEVSEEVARSVQQVADGGYVIAADFKNAATFGDFLIIRIDADGNLIWHRTEGLSYAYEGAEDVLETDSGDFLTAGYIVNQALGPSYVGCQLILFDRDGSKLWERIYNFFADYARSAVAALPDGTGYAVATDIFDYGSASRNMALFVIDEAGAIVWERTYGDASADRFMSFQPTEDGGYILAGNSERDEKTAILVVKVDGKGEF
jgi:hypothetical protein